jgi:2-amino-4-hydroxy-6-hydroxymethyldihydropteridine diphosphokinase
MTYLLGLGSNLGRRAANLARARRWLERKGVRILRASSTYETEPVDYRDQPWFLNQALEVRTALRPRELLGLVRSIEAQMKRAVGVLKGPRIIDIDILLAGDLVLETPDLIIPHPRLHLRNFVLVPLAEIAPRRRHPVLGRTLGALALASDDPSEVKIGRSSRGPAVPRTRRRSARGGNPPARGTGSR